MFRWELFACARHGHVLVGTDAAELRPEDHLFALDQAGNRWYRCLRCDDWVPMPPPAPPARPLPPDRAQVEIPLRGRALRNRYVLRLIALDRVVHVLVLAALTVAIFLFAAHRNALHHDYTRFLADLQAGLGGPVNNTHSGIFAELDHLFKLTTTRLYETGGAVGIYTILLAVEAVGLWRGRRWAEYLTFVETGILVPFEIYELTKTVSALKILTLVINLAVVLYLLLRHRLFGIRGGGRAEQAEIEKDAGWDAVERTAVATPMGVGTD